MPRLCWWIPACLLVGCSPTNEGGPTFRMPKQPIAFSASRAELCSPSDPMAALIHENPVAFLQHCIAQVEKNVHGYVARLEKQERIQGKIGPEEEIVVHFREKPFSVLMEWKRGHRLARKTLYVEGEHDNQIVVQPAGWRAIVGQVTCGVDDEDAQATSRYPITEFGMLMGTRRTLASWRQAQERGDLDVSLIDRKAIPELENRECWVLHRRQTPGLDPEGIVESTFYFDVATGLQVGTVLLDECGEIVAKYFFHDVELNPTFDDDAFCRRRMKK